MTPPAARDRYRGALALTLTAALVLSVLPYPGWLKFAAPNWVALALFYWCIAAPHRIGVGCGWGLGLLLDVLQGALLGQHALSKALLALLIVSNHRRLRLYPWWQQCLAVWVLGCADLAFHLIVYRLTQGLEFRLVYALGPIVTALLWPFVVALLRGVRA